jgi:hypothetical protein
MSGRVSLAPTNARHDADRLHPLRLSRIEILHILLEHVYDSQRNEDADSTRRLHRRQPVARSQDSFSPLRQFRRTGCRRRIGCTSRHEGSWRPAGDGSRRRSWQGPHAGLAGSRIPCLACGSSDKTVQLWDWPPPIQSAPRRQGTPTSSSRWGSAPVEPSSQAAGIGQPIFELIQQVALT